MEKRMGRTIEQQYEAQKEFVEKLLQSGKGDGYQLDSTIKIKLHALYKQIENGNCNSKKPFIPGFEKDVWNAWNQLAGENKIKLMKEYVNEAVIADFAVQEYADELKFNTV